MEPLVDQIKVVQATAFSLYLKAHNYHWNVTSQNFAQYHSFLGDMYEEVHDSIDNYAEIIRSLYSFAPGSLKRFSELSRIEDELDVPTALVMMATLATDNDILIAELYKADAICENFMQRGAQNYVQNQIGAHEKLRWQLKSFLK